MGSNTLKQPFLAEPQSAVPQSRKIENSARPIAHFHTPVGARTDGGGNVIYVDFSPADWRMATRRQFAQLRAYTTGWDGPNSSAIDDHTLAIAAHALESALTGLVDVPTPAIVPCADGGIQIEWCLPEGQFEMYFYTDGDVAAWLRDQTGAEHEGTGLVARELLKHWAARLGRTTTALAF